MEDPGNEEIQGKHPFAMLTATWAPVTVGGTDPIEPLDVILPRVLPPVTIRGIVVERGATPGALRVRGGRRPLVAYMPTYMLI